MRAGSNPARVVRITLLLLSFLLLPSFASSSSVSSTIPSSSSSKRRKGKASSHDHSSCGGGSNCDGNAVVPSHRKACGLYVWDLPSAVLYKWCHRLLKDRIYEGKGGYLFVRFETNSVLKLLYPCSRYSPNKCLICGGSYDDHLELWWSKHLYSPYDQYLDKTYNEALTIRDEQAASEQQRRRRRRRRRRSSSNNNNNRQFADAAGKQRNNSNGNRRSSSFVKTSSAAPLQTLSDPPRFDFHKRYVKDVTDVLRGVRDTRERRELVRKHLPSHQRNFLLIPTTDVTYVAPSLGGYDATLPKKDYTTKDSLIDLCNVMMYSCIDAVINLQRWEFANNKQKKSRASHRI